MQKDKTKALQLTEDFYCHWIKTFIQYHRYKHPDDMGNEEGTWLCSVVQRGP
ncbi:phage integrase N-terminal SAM-like domain-containing protein [Endozoicomonas euniceicola]|uniref:phage integrase N-terminal SAM-like domain-containing protein n=1 Tax=Endozoicomonas euniceicola TaxID=1234143 RepID=UPI00384C52AD